ncbi:MAG: hypothetical protein WBA57_18610 [Elainellaceae cyanobacterium]
MLHRFLPSPTRTVKGVTASLLAFGLVGIETLYTPARVEALPPPEDTPEEILRAEIILDARSPLDGEPLTAAEYAELQAALAEAPYPPSLDSELQQLIFLLRVRRMLRTLVPPLRLLD